MTQLQKSIGEETVKKEKRNHAEPSLKTPKAQPKKKKKKKYQYYMIHMTKCYICICIALEKVVELILWSPNHFLPHLYTIII